MLTFSSLGYTSSMSNTVLFEAWLEYRFGASFCTNFDHNLSQSTFTGKAKLSGEAWGVAAEGGVTETTVFLGTVPSLTVTVVDSTYDTAASTGGCDMTGSFVVQTFWDLGVEGDITFGTFTGANVALALGFSLEGGSSVEGSCDASYEANPGSAQHLTNHAPFELQRLGSCLV